jgi:hypothetical protein
VRLPQTAHDLNELLEGPVRVDGHSQHLPEHRDADLNADTGEKSGKHGLREKIRDEAELEEAGEE